MKTSIQQYLAQNKLDICFKLCLPLDCNDLIIFWYGNSFERMMDTLSRLCANFSAVIGEVFTIHACQAKFLRISPNNQPSQLLDQWKKAEPVFNRLQIYLRGNNHKQLFDDCTALRKKLSSNFLACYSSQTDKPSVRMHVIPGQEDVLLDFYSLPIDDFLRLYRMEEDGRPYHHTEKEENEVIIDGFCCGRISRTVVLSSLSSQAVSQDHDLEDEKNSEYQVSTTPHNDLSETSQNRNVDSMNVIELIKLLSDTMDQEQPPIWYSALMELLVELSNIEVSTTAYDIYVQAMPSQRRLVKVFIELLQSEDRSIKEELYSAQSDLTRKMIDYLSGWSQLSFHAMHAEWQLTQTSDINRLYIFPAKLCRLYCAYIEKSSKLLNTGATHEPCRFFLTPNISIEPTFTSVFKAVNKAETLIHGEIPAQFMFLPQVLLPILIHEAAHYAGQRIRNRKFRYTCLLRSMMAYILCNQIKIEYQTLEDEQGNWLLSNILDDLCSIIPLPPGSGAQKYYSENVQKHIFLTISEILLPHLTETPSNQTMTLIQNLLCHGLTRIKEYSHLDYIQRALAVANMLNPRNNTNESLLLSGKKNSIDQYINLFYQQYAEAFSDMCMIKLLDLTAAEYLYVIHCGNRYHIPLSDNDKVSLNEPARFDRYLCVLETAYNEQSIDELLELLRYDNMCRLLKGKSTIPPNDHRAIWNLAKAIQIEYKKYEKVPLSRILARQFLCDYLQKVSEALRETLGNDENQLSIKLRAVYKALSELSCENNAVCCSKLQQCLAQCSAMMHDM